MAQFQPKRAAQVCPGCSHNTSLWESRTTYCDVCYEAGGFYNLYEDGVMTEAEAKADFMAWAKDWHPTLSEDRLEEAWAF